MANIILPKFKIVIDDNLGFTVSVFGWLLPEDHELYTANMRSVTNITVSDLVKSVQRMMICPGVKPTELSSEIIHHVVPKAIDTLNTDDTDTEAMSSFHYTE